MSYTFYTCHTGIVSCHIFCLCRSHMSHVRPGLPEGAHLSLQPPSHCRLSYVRHRTDCVWLCTHTHLEKKMCKANVWSTLGVLVTVQSDCRGWKAKPWSRCQKSSWNNLDARSLTLKNSFIAMHRSNFREKTHPSSRWMNPNHILYTFVQRLFATQKIWHEHIAPPAELSWC